jgi:26S proteasome non-ATPase regulatory subunit 10
VQDLISSKAAIDPKDNSGWTPLMIAGKLILLNLFKIYSLYAVSAGHENVVQDLLGAGANASATNDKGLTPLYVSSALKKYSTIQTSSG